LWEKLIDPVPYLTISSRYADNSYQNGFFVEFILKVIKFVGAAFYIA
jgi:hypothetical protein